MKSLIVAEKASVGRDIAKALHLTHKQEGYIEGPDYTVTWARGHLMELKPMDAYDPKLKKWSLETLPFWPKTFQYDVIHGAGKEYRTIKKLIKSGHFNQIILATDNDREGQLIGETIFQDIGTGNIPVKRLLQDDWRESTVRDGLSHLIDNTDMHGLADAGYCRQHMDWIIGLNLTRAASVKYGGNKAINVGRIILPTLKFVYDRDKAIENFKPEDYYRLDGHFKVKNGEYDGTYMTKDKILDCKVLEAIKSDLQGLNGTVAEKEVKEQKKYPEALFNQAALQAYMTKHFNGWTASKVLSVCQSLYEKKVQTYPRTESRYLPESSMNDVKATLAKFGDYTFSKRPFNDKKVDSHGAIIPTGETPHQLSPDEEELYTQVKIRFLSQFMPPAIYEKTKIITKVGDIDFTTNGTVLKDAGWQALGGMTSKDKTLPQMEQNEAVKVNDLEIKTLQTKAPSPMTESELIETMETCGRKYKTDEEETQAILSGFSIGTGATRHQAIDKIVKVGYVQRKKKQLVTTEFGRKFVEVFPAKKMFNADFTGKIEYSLKNVEKGTVKPAAFMKSVKRYTMESVQAVKDSKATLPVEGSLGKCPICGGDVIDRGKVFKCVHDDFLIYKLNGLFDSFGKKVTKTIVKQALADKDHKITLKYTKSKKGTSGSVDLILTPPKDGEKFARWEYVHKKSKRKQTDYKCPVCGSSLNQYQKGWGCSAYPNCNFFIYAEISGHKMTEKDVKQLLDHGSTDEITDFYSRKKKKKFSAKLVLDDGYVAFDTEY